MDIRITSGGEMEAKNEQGAWVQVPKAAADEIHRCHDRLEIDRVYNIEGERQIVSFEARLRLPDGIEARGLTISLIEGEL